MYDTLFTLSSGHTDSVKRRHNYNGIYCGEQITDVPNISGMVNDINFSVENRQVSFVRVLQ